MSRLLRPLWCRGNNVMHIARNLTHFITPVVESHLLKIERRHLENLEIVSAGEKSAQDIEELSKKISTQETLISEFRKWKKLRADLVFLEEMDRGERDPTMRQLINSETEQMQCHIKSVESDIKRILLGDPTNENDCHEAVMEIRAATGGEEATLFANELLLMYEKYCLLRGWKFSITSISEEGADGIREVSVQISGADAYKRLFWESGVHRVQRIPKTESQGRIHTSTVTVAILPRSEAIDISISEKDLRIDSFKSSGPGGQHVNKTNSAVRVVHIPTGIHVAVQEERCAQQNRARALLLLRSKLMEMKRLAQETERRTNRQSQIGSGDRSEKIRTYNFPQARITDHRLGASLHGMEQFFTGEKLDTFIDALMEESEKERLLAILNS